MIETSQRKADNVSLPVTYVIFDYDDDEPPLNDDELHGLEIADGEIAEGKAIPFSEVFRDLW